MGYEHPLLVLNASVITADGSYEVRTIQLDEATRVLKAAREVDSAVRHASTARALLDLTGVAIELADVQAEQKPGQLALVFKPKGRIPEGAILSREDLDRMGYEFKLIDRCA